MVVVFILLGIALFLLGVFLFRSWLFSGDIVKAFRSCNVVVDGKKGKGKDLVFQYVIHKRKKSYYSNIDYGGSYSNVKIQEISCSPNTYKDFIVGEVTPVPRWAEEKKDVYISDGGIFLPSYMDSTLYKLFPSLPIYYALSRHLGDHNIHVNIQNEARLWKALREQADYFVHVHKRVILPHFILIKCYAYDKEASAQSVLRPLKVRWFNKFQKAEVDVYRAQHGEIKGGWIILPKKWIKYDTRAFEKVVYPGQDRLTSILPKKRLSLFRKKSKPISDETPA